MFDAPSVHTNAFITDIDANIDGFQPYRYRRLINFDTYLAAAVKDVSASNKKEIDPLFVSFELKDMIVDGIYSKLAEVQWRSIAEAGYEQAEDIGSPEKAKMVEYYYELNKRFPTNRDRSDYVNGETDFYKLGKYLACFDTVKDTGERVLYYNKSIQQANADKETDTRRIFSDAEIKQGWKEISTTSTHDELKRKKRDGVFSFDKSKSECQNTSQGVKSKILRYEPKQKKATPQGTPVDRRTKTWGDNSALYSLAQSSQKGGIINLSHDEVAILFKGMNGTDADYESAQKFFYKKLKEKEQQQKKEKDAEFRKKLDKIVKDGVTKSLKKIFHKNKDGRIFLGPRRGK